MVAMLNQLLTFVKNNANTIIIFYTLFYFLLMLIGIERSPVVWIDEVTLNDPARALSDRGIFCSPIQYAEGNYYDRVYYWQPPGLALVTSCAYKLFGFGIWQTRISGVLFGALAIYLIYRIGLILFDDWTGALAASVILSIDPSFIMTLRSGRMDAQCIFFIILSLYLFFRVCTQLKSGNVSILPQSCLVGLMLGLALISHPLAVFWIVIVSLLFFMVTAELKWPTRILYSSLFLCFAALPSLLWIGYAIARHELPMLIEQFVKHGQSKINETSLLGNLKDTALRIVYFYKTTPLLVVLYGAAAVVPLKSIFADRALYKYVKSIFWVIFTFYFFVMDKHSTFFHLYYIVPLAILSGGLIGSILSSNRDRSVLRFASNKVLVLFVMVTFVLTSAASVGARLLVIYVQWDARDYARVHQLVKRTIPEGSNVFGTCEAWYALEWEGSTLRIQGRPDPLLHDYAIVKDDSEVGRIPGAKKIASLESDLSELLGFIKLPTQSYQMSVWKLKSP